MNAGPVVIIEDDEAIGEVLEDYLGGEGYSVVRARNGVDGLEILRKVDRPHAVILDLAMPRLSGREVLNRFRSEHPEVPTIVTSSDLDKEVMSQARFALAKPYSLFELQRLLDSLPGAPIRQRRKEEGATPRAAASAAAGRLGA